MSYKFRKNAALTALVLYWGLILTLTSLPQANMPNVQTNDKVSHFLAYLGLAFLLYAYLRLRRGFNSDKKKLIIIVIATASLYGALDELHQLFVPGRSADVIDWIADTLGAIAGIILITGIEKYLPSPFMGNEAADTGNG